MSDAVSCQDFEEYKEAADARFVGIDDKLTLILDKLEIADSGAGKSYNFPKKSSASGGAKLSA